MKLKLIISTLCTAILVSQAYAKTVSVPFIQQVVPEEGLYIRYSLAGKHPQKVSCVFENFYKGYLKYTENNVEQNSGIAFGDGYSGDQMYFSNKEPRWDRTQGLDSLDQFHVDEKGYIHVKNVKYLSTVPVATCFYTSELAS